MNKLVKQINPMLCPVCGQFYFSRLSKYEIEEGTHPNAVQCRHCGWFYDLEQTKNPDLAHQSNVLSLNQFKKEYEFKIKLNSNYDFFEANTPKPQRHLCPVCHEHYFKDVLSFDICPICGWQDDDEYNGGGANKETLQEAKEIFATERTRNPKYKWINDIKRH